MAKQRLWLYAIHVLAWGLLFLFGRPPAAPTPAHATVAPPAPALRLAAAPATPACDLAWQPGNAPVLTYHGVSALAAGDAWAVGVAAPATNDVVLHWDGATWTTVPVPSGTPWPIPTPPNLTWQYYAVAGDGPGAAWVAGGQTTGFDSNPPLLLRVTLTETQALTGPARRPAGGYAVYDTFLAVAVVAPGEAWAVGSETSDFPQMTGGAISAHCTTTGCSGPNVISPNTSAALYAVAAAGPADIWAGGTYAPTPGGPYTALLEHYDGAAWQVVPAPPIGVINGLAALAAQDVWAVANGGIIHWDGATWTQVPAPAAGPLRAITMPAADDGWAVGDAGLLHWDGAAWTLAPGPSGIVALSSASPYDVWAASRLTLYHYSAAPAFADVPAGQPFYPYVQDLACRGAISGYTCGAPGEPCPGTYFRPSVPVTRGQLAKIIANTAALTETVPPAQQTFRDVPPGHPFWLPVERLAARGAISGYQCGGPGEPCPGVYFRPSTGATRGQIAKIVATAAGLTAAIPPTQQTFVDVPPAQPFWVYIERLAARGSVSGYTCGAPGEPCPGLYFRPAAGTTRGQTAKIVDTTFAPAAPAAGRE